MRDTLFKDKDAPQQDFQFTPKVAEVFEDMMERSVPFYRDTMVMVSELLEGVLQPGDLVYDLGCSTGTTLIELARHLTGRGIKFVGVDSSAAMIAKAEFKAEAYSRQGQLHFIQAEILDVPLERPAAIMLHYTLQFIRPMQRPEFLIRLHRALKPGGILLLLEKTICHSPAVNRAFIDCHLNFKRQHGYSEIEITKKRESLENVLIPFSISENLEILRGAGFSEVETFFQWFNFAGFVARKAAE